jgi:hypothetical protein
MLFASFFNQVLGTLCVGFFAVILVISVAVFFGVRFIKRNDEARKSAKKIIRAIVVEVANIFLKP